MKRFLSIGSMFALALVVGIAFAPKVQGDMFDPLGGIGRQLEEQIAGFDEAIRASITAGSFVSTIKSIQLNTAGGYACEGGAVKSISSRGFLVTASNDRKAIFTVANEDVLKRTLSAAMAAQLAGLNVYFIGAPTACTNVSNITELTITK